LNRSQVCVFLAALGFSFILIFSTLLRNTGFSSFEQVVFRLSFGLPMLALFMLFKRKLRLIRIEDFSFFALLGVVYSLFVLSGVSAIAFGASITVVTSLIYTQPVFTAVISQLTGKEKITAAKAGVIFVGVLGAFLVSGMQITNLRFDVGVIFPVFGGLAFALYLWLKRQATSMTEYTPYQILFYTFLFAFPSVIIAWAIMRNVSTNPLFVGITTPNTLQLGMLLLFTGFSTVLPYSLLNYVKAEEISPTSEGLLLLGDPLLHTLWAILLFKQYVTVTQYVGAGLILLSAAMNLKLTAKST